MHIHPSTSLLSITAVSLQMKASNYEAWIPEFELFRITPSCSNSSCKEW
jgi:hypothetical protein